MAARLALLAAFAGTAFFLSVPTGLAESGPDLQSVRFVGASRPLGSLQERQARNRGEEPRPTPGAALIGYLAKPEGSGPFPALVVLHGCRGVTNLERQRLVREVVGWGYVYLAVDSFSPRNIAEGCVVEPPSVDRVADAYGGLVFLAHQRLVDRTRVGVLGVSMGATGALTLAESQTPQSVINPEGLSFSAGVAFYPNCEQPISSPAFPLLIMVGGEDQWAHAGACKAMEGPSASAQHRVEVITYPGVSHGFAEEDWRVGQGFDVRYDETAATDAFRKAASFFKQHLQK